jgi:hypothetical protein
MNQKTIETYLPCYRAGKPMDARTVKAARAAEKNDSLRRRLEEQKDFDAQVVAALHSIQPPKNLRQKLTALAAPEVSKTPSFRSQLGHPAMLSAVAGVLLMVGFLVFSEMDRMQAFRGKEAVERMIATTDEMSGVELEPAHAPAGELGDGFYIRGFEGYALPPQLAKLPAVGTRVFRQNGHRIAQVAVDAHNALLFVFRGTDFGVDLEQERGWKTFTQEGWVAAVRADNGLCTMIAFRGDKAEMQRFLESLSQ